MPILSNRKLNIGALVVIILSVGIIASVSFLRPKEPKRIPEAFPITGVYQAYFELQADKTIGVLDGEDVNIDVYLTTSGEEFDAGVAVVGWDPADFKYKSAQAGNLPGDEDSLHTYSGGGQSQRTMVLYVATVTPPLDYMTTTSGQPAKFFTLTLTAQKDNPTSDVRILTPADGLVVHFVNSGVDNSLDQSLADQSKLVIHFSQATPTPTSTATSTPTSTPTPTPTSTPTPTPTPSPTPGGGGGPTATPTSTPTSTPTPTPTATPTPTPTATPTPTPFQGEIIIDNLDSNFSFTGNWTRYNQTADFHYNNSHHYTPVNQGTDGDTVSWSFSLSKTGTYEVYSYIWGCDNPSYRCWRPVDAPYTINYEGGSSTVEVNQREAVHGWKLLGEYGFSTGNTYNVTLTDNGIDPTQCQTDPYPDKCDLVADAIKLVYVHSGIPTPTPTPTPTPPGSLEFEAEDMTLTLPMTVNGDSAASGGQYIQIASGNNDQPYGMASHTFNIDQPGNYKIEARVIASTTGKNSFFITMDNQNPQDPQDVWDILDLSSAWVWDDVTQRGAGSFDNPQHDPRIFNLSAGNHTLYIHSRERETKLDKLRIVLAGISPTPTPHPACQLDYDDSGSIEIEDIRYLLRRWNSSSFNIILILLNSWGRSC